MKIKYFQDTDTLHIEFRVAAVAESKDLDENTLLDLDEKGNICSITIDARQRARRHSAFFIRASGHVVTLAHQPGLHLVSAPSGNGFPQYPCWRPESASQENLEGAEHEVMPPC